jgi:hypothetical protein
MKSPLLCLLIVSVLAVAVVTPSQGRSLGHFNQKGNILIADQFNNRVIEVNPNSHAIVWSFGDSGTNAGPTTILAPHDAERVGALTLITCTGVPADGEPGCPDGCPDNRVIIITKKGRIVWQYGQAGVTGAGTNELNRPITARWLPHRDVLITDQGNQRVIQVTHKGDIKWQYGTSGVSGSASNQLSNPDSAEQRATGDTLIADQGNNRVIMVNHRNRVVMQYDSFSDNTSLNGPAYAARLHNGHIVITDSLNNRIIEANPKNPNVNIFEYVTSARPGSVANPNPTRALRLRKGNTLISDQFNHQIIEIDMNGNIVFTFGTIGVAGNGSNELNAPCDAKVIGDFTNLTSPKGGGGGGFNISSLF